MNRPARHVGRQRHALVTVAPVTSIKRPSIASPTGTSIGPPVARTGAPRRNPFVERKARARTVVSSRWACTSAIIGEPSSVMMTSASSIGGKAVPSKATSTTAPRTAVTRPSMVFVFAILLSPVRNRSSPG